ncbi:twin-arginine translocation protein, TatB subunit [Candidatus Ruthia magnifica str. Cm (Calyptogena magnifica)]|uniref:Twin-arginine translocation protein, TatB subunit n=1 Tax=Ruthia magnifica subsp. Calyptogena magnifica TaxID=413404 RepID=A1AVW0_RUTMC|nr:Sec-independent protein translocase protein TatB [Candidatus Ruthturnera calyptogenae]ABL02067.1 twin-arginine translocation protein, TatB subunit [Candidatus Ruthia magnifica str. Cm (Calyptogena magnifica)]
MFDVGFWEFALIGIIALIIVGPKRMPAIARKAGTYVGKAKRFIANIQEDISDELEIDKLKEHLSTVDKKPNILEIFDDTKNTFNDVKNNTDQK